jgi:5-methyltetrahydrofolate--homocysteine methyltransferase
VAAIHGVRRASALPLVMSFSFDQGVKTMMGLSPTRMVEAIVPLGVASIGANCGRSPADMEKVVEELAGASDVARYDTTPEMMADYARRFIEAGARIVVGCCGSTPRHVGAIAEAVKSRNIDPSRLGV